MSRGSTSWHWGNLLRGALSSRARDVLAALTVFVGIQLLGLPVSSLLTVNLALAVGLVGLGLLVVREHRRLGRATTLPVLRAGALGAPALRSAA